MFIIILVLGAFVGIYGCRGDCVNCQKSGSQTLSYCENDFPSHAAYKDQITGLDSAGYACTAK